LLRSVTLSFKRGGEDVYLDAIAPEGFARVRFTGLDPVRQWHFRIVSMRIPSDASGAHLRPFLAGNWNNRGICIATKRMALKTLRFVMAPTRHRRLNEILGLVVVVAAVLLLLALVSYTPSDPSFNTVGTYASGRPAHNWAGLVGAWIADSALQVVGVSIFLLPLVLVRLGVSWLRSRPAGSAYAKTIGLGLWTLFAPAAIALLPRHLLWRHALPIEGVTGRIVADAMVEYLNLPGACIVVGLMVCLSLYLATTFTFNTAREWIAARFAFVGRIREWQANLLRAKKDAEANAVIDAYESKRERAIERARRAEAKARKAAPDTLEPLEAREVEPSTSLLSGLFGWLGRRKQRQNDLSITPHEKPPSVPTESVWRKMPRTDVDAPPATALATASAAAAPYAEALSAASAPLFTEQAFDLPDRAPAPWALDEALAPEPMRSAKLVEMPHAVASPMLAPEPVPTLDRIAFGRRADADQVAVIITPKSVRGYKLPPSTLLFQSEDHGVVREEALREEARVLVEKCAEFGVDGQVTQINPGPVVTTFEFRPDAGVKYARVTGLADDLCLAMAAESILIERMAGKSTVGIQVPNHERETIWLRDVVECESFAQSKSKLAIALGKDINGRIVTADLAAMPHVLIAGSTGSGKSVAINAMIMSVLFKSTPEQVRMILVDPKRVELGMYEGIPHLFTPIITEAKLAANALRNAVREMERRLKLLAANHVRNIDQFNKLFDHGSEYLFEDVNQEPLPYIIIIIDELADLMMLDRANVEESITRLAQMARAVGIHLVLATQRPSVDVITGLIKANVPTRMSFRLATKVDSRTIIDSNGAESLLGRGDMLYLPPGTSRVQRVHAPFVTEKEIAAVTEFWRAQGEAEYVHGFLEGPKDDKDKEDAGEPSGDDHDPLFDDAMRLVFEFGKASTSLLQRRLRIGYGRAAHLIDLMERDGLVGPADGSKPREILKSPGWISEVDAALR
jgi:S-DNA-T family DNA segregation ATPase FtsK/SpoIIIE